MPLCRIPLSAPLAAAIGLAVACGVACGQRKPIAPALNLTGGRGVTVYFVVGYLGEYLGRRVVENDDLVEELYCNEADKLPVLRRQLEKLAREQGFTANLREEKVQECLTAIRSAVLADALNAVYQRRNTPSTIESWTTDAQGRRLHLTTLFVDDELFRDVDRDLKLAYVAGAYARNGAGDSMRFANSQHKVDVLVRLLQELGCSGVRTESSQGFIPQTNTIYFEPSPEVRDWITRAW